MIEVNQYLILNKKKYFAIAEEFIKLTQIFKNQTLFEKLNFWIDMIIYPILTLISIVQYNQKLGVFKIIYIHKAVTKWQQYFRYLELKSEIDEWKLIIESTGGPVISTNDDTYQTYVYADAIQRLHDKLFT